MKLTESEWHLMNALWRDHPATARQIGTRLPEGVRWAYTTIKTMLTRLVEKGAVAEEKKGNVSLYRPLLTQRKARGNALKALLNHAFDGAVGPLVHFLTEEQELSKQERQELIHILRMEGAKKTRNSESR